MKLLLWMHVKQRLARRISYGKTRIPVRKMQEEIPYLLFYLGIQAGLSPDN